MKDKLLRTLYQHLIQLFHVHFGSEGDSRQGLGLAPGENSRAVRSGQIAHLAPDRADLSSAAAVQTNTLVYNHTAHGLFLHRTVISVDHHGLVLSLFLGNGLHELLFQSIESVLTLMLCKTALGYGVAFVVAVVADGLAEILVILLVAVSLLLHLPGLHHHLLLHAALLLDGLVSKLDGIEHLLLAHLLHLALDHHDILLGSGDYEFHVGLVHNIKRGIDHKLSVDTGNPHLGNRAVPGDIAYRQCCRSRKTRITVRHIDLVGRYHNHIDKYLSVEIIGEQRTQSPVHQTGHQNLRIRSTSLSLEESTGITHRDNGLRRRIFPCTPLTEA